MNVGILLGGNSPERDVSLATGQAMYEAVLALGYKGIKIELGSSLSALDSPLQKVDVVLNALHGGMGENGIVQGYLDTLGIPYTGSGALSSALCMDKHFSKIIVRDAGLRTPDWELLPASAPPAEVSLAVPLVVKPVDQGSTVGLSIVHQVTELETAWTNARPYSRRIMMEKFIPGREITVAVIDGNPYPVVEIIPSHELYDYECKYSQGLSNYTCPADLEPTLTQQIQEAAEAIYGALGCRHYGRVDFRLDGEEYWFLEMNTLPGMTATSLVPKAVKAAGMSFHQLIDTLLTLAMKS
ncbi:MAG: D-alanine--D-alanine ligase [Fidelibacterota bacterium]